MQIRVTNLSITGGSLFATVEALIDGHWQDLPIKTEAPQVVIEQPKPVKEPRDDFGYYKIGDIVKTPSTKGEPLLPISRSTWLNGIEAGRFPKPAKLAGRNIWPKKVIHELLDDIARKHS